MTGADNGPTPQRASAPPTVRLEDWPTIPRMGAAR
jgi:hypothetical protein